MNFTKNNIVGKIVADDYRTATVFKSHKIDFCCQGNRTIETVCESAKIDAQQMINELNDINTDTQNTGIDFKSWENDLLADYIEKKHHRYVLNRIPELKEYLNKVAKVHGERHPELIEIEQLFTASAHELLAHMQKEENILFPYIRSMANNEQSGHPHFGTVQNPIAIMMQEHDNEGERFRQIAKLSNDYIPPADGCTTYKVAFAMLKEFEEDLHLHIHLENNILFPRAIEAEQKLAYA